MSALLLTAALALARAGWAVFPLRGKVPLVARAEGGRGHLDATTDPERIATWWDRWPRANVGARIPAALVLVDFDPRSGAEESVAAWEAAHGPLPPTLTAYSGRGDGGRHLWFRAPGGALSAARLPAGVDLKAPGRGYAVMPPSRHPTTGRPYRWAEPRLPPAPLPGWLAKLLAPPAPPPVPRPVLRCRDRAGSAYAFAALSAEVSAVADAAVSTRNATLYRAARNLGELAAAGALEAAAVVDALLGAAAAAGLPEPEAARTVASGMRAGYRRPRELAR